jgi:murein endopeptidase
VQFPAASPVAFTWDFPLGVSPSRQWRRWGTEKLVSTLECVLAVAQFSDPLVRRVGVADLSRPQGGPFGSRYGGLGHASHQNGLDADVLYPRLDGCECAPQRVAQIDVRRSQRLVSAFVAAGAQYVFVSPALWRRGRLRGPRTVVRPLVHHDDHLHVRLRP